MSFRNYVKSLPAWTAGQADTMSLLQRCSERAPRPPERPCQEDLACISSAGNRQISVVGQWQRDEEKEKQGRRPMLGHERLETEQPCVMHKT